MAVEIGEIAPTLPLPTTDGGSLSLGSKQRHTVLFFYPKDNTAGCTMEAQDFSRLRREFDAAGADIVGISIGDLKGKLTFARKRDLQVTLAADVEGELCRLFDVWVEKTMYGRRFMGVERSTFLIDPEGRIVRAWRKVAVPGHAEAVLETLRGCSGQPVFSET